MIRAVVFDLDGTLADTIGDIASAANATLQSLGRPGLSGEQYRALVGWGLGNLLATITSDCPLSEPEFQKAHGELMDHYRESPVAKTVLYPGIGPLVAELADRVNLGVVTNKEEALAQAIVDRLFPQKPFHALRGYRPDTAPKPDPAGLISLLGQWKVAPSEAVLLGDSEIDVETAHRAGVLACGALWGYRNQGELACADEVFSSPSEFRDWLMPRTGTGQNDKTNRN